MRDGGDGAGPIDAENEAFGRVVTRARTATQKDTNHQEATKA